MQREKEEQICMSIHSDLFLAHLESLKEKKKREEGCAVGLVSQQRQQATQTDLALLKI